MSEAKRHHYIPQFILKNFLDNKGQVFYWDIEKEVLEKRNPRSIFMNFDMYRDEVNHKDKPTSIESSLAIFEGEIATLIRQKFLKDNEIIITRSELEALRIFLSLLSFRSDLRKDQYKNCKFNESTKTLLEKYAKGNFEDLWKREIEILSKCRTFKDVKESEEIDPIIKTDFMNDIIGFYMTIIEARGGEFLLTDVYPTIEIFPVRSGVNLHMHCIYPISNNRVLLLNHIMFKPELQGNSLTEPMRRISQIKGDMIMPPKNKYKISRQFLSSEDQYIYKVRKIYAPDIEYINALLLNEARIGVMFTNVDSIQQSVIQFNRRKDTKKGYAILEKEIESVITEE